MVGGGEDSTRPKEAEGGFVRSSNGNLKRTSKFAGVNFHKRKGKWENRVTVPGKKLIRSSFVSEVEAAENYDNVVSNDCFYFD